MKKLYTTLSLVVLLSGGSVSAGVATGNSTEWTQLLNNVQLLFSGAREAVTAVQQTIETAKVSIGNPFLAAMITGAQQQAAREMNNWARGNFN